MIASGCGSSALSRVIWEAMDGSLFWNVSSPRNESSPAISIHLSLNERHRDTSNSTVGSTSM